MSDKLYFWQVIADFANNESIVLMNCGTAWIAEIELKEIIDSDTKWFKKTDGKYLNLDQAHCLRIVTPDEQKKIDKVGEQLLKSLRR